VRGWRRTYIHWYTCPVCDPCCIYIILCMCVSVCIIIYEHGARATADSRGSHRCCKLRQRDVHYYYYRDASTNTTTPPPRVVIHYILFTDRYCNSNLVPRGVGVWGGRGDRILLYRSIYKYNTRHRCVLSQGTI